MKVAKIWQDAILPTRKHPTDAGLDFYAYREVLIPANNVAVVFTGITVEIPTGFFGLIKPKGGSNYIIGAGVVDEGYQGEILVKVINPYSFNVVIGKGQAVAQMVLVPCFYAQLEEVPYGSIHQAQSTRGDTGGIKTATFTAKVEEG